MILVLYYGQKKTMAYVEYLLKRLEETSYFLTACFLNGLFSAVKNQHVREIKCVAAGEPYCVWEIDIGSNNGRR